MLVYFFTLLLLRFNNWVKNTFALYIYSFWCFSSVNEFFIKPWGFSKKYLKSKKKYRELRRIKVKHDNSLNSVDILLYINCLCHYLHLYVSLMFFSH